MRNKFQIMRDRRRTSDMKKLANAYDAESKRLVSVTVSDDLPAVEWGGISMRSLPATWGEVDPNKGLGLGLYSPEGAANFYDAKTNGDLNQYRLGSRFGDPSIQASTGLSSSGLGLGLMGCHSQPLAADCSAYNIKGPGGVQFQQHPSKAGVDADLNHSPVLSDVIPRAPKHWLSSVFELISVQLRKAKAYLAHCAKKALG